MIGYSDDTLSLILVGGELFTSSALLVVGDVVSGPRLICMGVSRSNRR